MSSTNSTIKCNRIDHYTLIVPDAKAVSDFHKNVLGYPFLEIKEVNAGSVPQGQYDMINYIHEWPDDSGRVLVITEGLTDGSIFRRFMAKYGQGIHHLALQVDDLDQAWDSLKEKGIKLTSAHIMFDFLSGLKQIFLDNADTGVFIELIERNKSDDFEINAAQKGFFTHDNMAGLAETMTDYITDVVQAKKAKQENAIKNIIHKIPGIKLREFILDVADPETTAKFFEDTFGFVRAKQALQGDIRIFLETEPDLCFLCRKTSTALMNHGLICQTELEEDFITGLWADKDGGIQLSNKALNISSTLTGYPMSLVYA